MDGPVRHEHQGRGDPGLRGAEQGVRGELGPGRKQFPARRQAVLLGALRFDRYEDEFFDSYTRGYSMETSFDQHPAYYNYSYPYYQQEQPFSYLESAAPLNNERYTGRLKFFDQAGNYGYCAGHSALL